MNSPKPILDLATHYRIEVQGRINVEWLQSLNSSAEIDVDETRDMEEITVLNVHTDQAGIVGLVRRPHGLGMTILQPQLVSNGGRTANEETSTFYISGFNAVACPFRQEQIRSPLKLRPSPFLADDDRLSSLLSPQSVVQLTTICRSIWALAVPFSPPEMVR